MMRRRQFGLRGARLLVLVGATAAPVFAGSAAASPAAALLTQVAAFQAAPGAGAPRARVAAEVAQLRAALDRKTAEITALKKRGDRSVREDYELRQHMAEANELARRLTALESQMGGAGRPAAAPAAGAVAAPAAGAVEAPATLEARADLLSDEAHKLEARAAGMMRAAGQLRTRHILRKRAGVVDRDPFAGLDGSKRLMVVRAGATPLGGKGRSGTESAPTGGPGADSPTTTGGAGTGNNTPAMPGGGGATPTPTSGPALAPPSNPPPPAGMAAPTAAPPPTAPTPPMAPTPVPASDTSTESGRPAAAPATRTELAPGSLIDPALRAELSRAGVSAVPAANDPESLERAAAALVNRARSLEAEAKALRAKAATR